MGQTGHIVVGNSESERVIIELVGPRVEEWTVAHVEVGCGVCQKLG
jgi:hypothetical protein